MTTSDATTVSADHRCEQHVVSRCEGRAAAGGMESVMHHGVPSFAADERRRDLRSQTTVTAQAAAWRPAPPSTREATMAYAIASGRGIEVEAAQQQRAHRGARRCRPRPQRGSTVNRRAESRRPGNSARPCHRRGETMPAGAHPPCTVSCGSGTRCSVSARWTRLAREEMPAARKRRGAERRVCGRLSARSPRLRGIDVDRDHRVVDTGLEARCARATP